jgi:hypothetical protein
MSNARRQTMKNIALAESLGRERRDRVGAVLSIVLHILALMLIIAIFPEPSVRPDKEPEQTITITKRLTIVHRPKPAPTAPPVIARAPVQAAAPAAASAPKIAVTLRIPTAPVRPDLPVPHVLKHLILKQKPKTVAYVPPAATRPVVSRPEANGQLSSAHLAQINRDLGQAIAADRTGIDGALSGTSTQVAYTKHYSADVGSFTTGELRHHGLCDPIKNWQQDGYNYYFVACNVRFSDGTYERQPVPWPVRFKPSRDPFAGTFGGEEPLALPLPGWTLPAGETITKELRQYALDNGVTLPQ